MRAYSGESFCTAGHAQEGGSESNGMNEEGQGAVGGRGIGNLCAGTVCRKIREYGHIFTVIVLLMELLPSSRRGWPMSIVFHTYRKLMMGATLAQPWTRFRKCHVFSDA